MDAECRRSGQIPAFGNWDYANELPITQYFESARQAGLIRHCSSTTDDDLHAPPPPGTASGHLYKYNDAVEFNKPHLRTVVVSSRKHRQHQHHHQKKRQQQQHFPNQINIDREEEDKKKEKKNYQYYQHSGTQQTATTNFKPVDEDLYKIPPDLLHSSKRKKMLGFLSRCLVPGCIV
ncbi:hypothetical protein LguiB_035555 [Lonicera macranthoides]